MVADESTLNIENITERLEILQTSLEALRRDIGEYIDQNDGDNTTHYYFDRQMLGILGEVAATQTDVLAIETQVAQLNELIRTSALITSSLELEFVLEEVLDAIIQLTGAERSMIFLTHAEGHKVALQAARDWQQNTLDEGELTISNSVIQDVVATRQPLITTDAQSDLRFQKTASVIMNELRSIIALPLVVRAHLIGVLYLDSRLSHGIFNEDNFPILMAFANQAAIAIDNARQYAQVRSFLQTTHHELMQIAIEINEESVSKRVEEITTSQLFLKLKSFKQNPSDSNT